MKFDYTFDGGSLNDAQRQFYEENGFIVFKKLIDDENLEKCKRRFLGICNGEVDPGFMIVMKESTLKKRKDIKGEYLINKIQDFLYDDVLFESYACHKKMIEVIAGIIGPDITAVHSMLINKPPDSTIDNSRHPLHQDLHYFPFRPANRIVASWTAMERINIDNGCLFVIPGSHKSKLYRHELPQGVENFAYHGVQGFDHVPRVNLCMEKGDTVFFHPLILHGSGPNRTKGFRKAISVHYACSDSHFIDVRGTVQEDIAKEVEAIIKKRGFETKFQDYWKGKSRFVAGQPGSFQQYNSQL